MSWYVSTPSPFYYLNQNNVPTWDGSYSENATLNCGETCVSMIVKHLREVYIPPDTIKDVMLGQAVTGPTTAGMLQNFLQNNCNINTTLYTPTQESNSSNTGLVNMEWSYLDSGKPLIYLGTLTLNGINYNHWRVVVGLSDTYVYLADPWYGSQIQQSYNQHWNGYKGFLIGIEETRHI